jgi:hypothetical protein
MLLQKSFCNNIGTEPKCAAAQRCACCRGEPDIGGQANIAARDPDWTLDAGRRGRCKIISHTP